MDSPLKHSESAWNHTMCPRCWLRREGTDREPVRVTDDDSKPCCFCGASTAAGIYVRGNPAGRDLVHCVLRGIFASPPAAGGTAP